MFIRKNRNIGEFGKISTNTLSEHLGMELTEIGDDYLIMRMPVDHRTVQPMGVLNGGASMALAETVGSYAGSLCLEEGKAVVGQSITGNHIRPVTSGYVYAKASPLHIGKRSHVWDITITNDEGKLVCVSRLTLAVFDV